MVFFDVLYQRYANPDPLMLKMIKAKRLTEFVNSVVKKHNEETKYKYQWEYWLHREFTRSFEEYSAGVDNALKSNEEIKKTTLVKTVKNSFDILSNFVPTKEGEQK